MKQVEERTLAWARARQGLTRVEAVGALAFYLVDMAARMYRRQLRMQYVEPYLNDLSALGNACQLARRLPTPSATPADITVLTL